MRKHKLIYILTKEFLIEQHYNLKKTLSQISKEIGCDHKTVKYYLEYWNLIHYEFYPDKSMKNHHGWQGYEDISLTYWNNVKNGAKSRNIKFDITIEEAWNIYINQNKRCALSGQKIEFIRSKNNTASLDRIDSSKGYIKDNIQWVHRDINFAKQSMNNEEFIKLCRSVVNYKNKKI